MRAIVSIFETGLAVPDYDAYAVLDDGAGVSYGAHQATHRSGSLLKVVTAYLERGGQVAGLRDYLDELQDISQPSVFALGRDTVFKRLLKQAAAEPAMHEAQEIVFDVHYMQPSLRLAERFSFNDPLSLGVIYDSQIQGSFERVRTITNRVFTRPVGEREWIAEYCRQRYGFLLGLPRASQRRSVYRPNVWLGLIQQNRWALELPLTVRGVTITKSHVE